MVKKLKNRARSDRYELSETVVRLLNNFVATVDYLVRIIDRVIRS